MNIAYPIFAFEKDDKSMHLVESESHILQRLEAIDIENDEYAFWDANANGVSVRVAVYAFKGRLIGVTSCTAEFPLQDAFASYAKSVGLYDFAVDGQPVEVWRRIQAKLDSRP